MNDHSNFTGQLALAGATLGQPEGGGTLNTCHKPMTRQLERSHRHFEKASKKLPLGVASNFRFWGPDKTIYIDHAKGGRIWDLDGNEYVDYRLGYGPSILGYGDERVDEAAREGMKIGGVFGLSTERELTVAERISSMVQSAEMIRYSNSGTEAVMAALRLARAYSGKDSYIVIEGGYHGVFDAVLWSTDIEEWEPGEGSPLLLPDSDGVPMRLKQMIHPVPLNDVEALEGVLKTHGDDIGALLIEPIMGNCCSITASVAYMRKVRALCDNYKVVLIIDEVKTGFRVARGGVQELTGVHADLCTFAKAVANGYPISVLAGKKEIMQKIGEGVLHGGTYTAHSVTLAAAEKTLELLDETDALATIESYGRQIQDGISEILNRRSIAHSFTGHPSMAGLFFSEDAPTNYRDWKNADYTLYDTIAPELHERGVLCEPDSREPWFICEAHDDLCLSQTIEAFEGALSAALDQLSPQRQTASSNNTH